MRQKKSFGQRAEEFLSGKGFYIVLFVCVAVIGVSAWLLLFSQYSPLASGGTEDYLDAMGDMGSIDIDLDLDDEPASNPYGGNIGPEHDVPDAEPEPEPEPAPAPDPDSLTREPNRPDDKDALVIDDAPNAGPEPEAEDKDGGGAESAKTVKDLSFIWPISGSVTVGYSPDMLIYSNTMGDWRTHDGIDVAVTLGTKVLSAASGTVTRVEATDDMGTTVEIDHGAGVVTTYANLAGAPTVKVGDSVTMGSVIGSVGATALYETGDSAHLHFSMTVNGESVDPTRYLPKK